ncbi:MAG: guanylate kinase [Parachlamydia sp.]|nr:guanylate kinase [Parachlamydia sp.]
MSSKGLLFIVSAPAGTGKTTLVTKLIEEFSNALTSVSFTTRKPRQGEVEGRHYHFVTKDQFEKKIADKEFLEYVTLYGDYYGTSQKWVEEQQQKGKHVFLTIDTQGALQLKKRQAMSGIYIFIMPPSLDALKERLYRRKTETPEVIEARLEWARQEIKIAGEYDYNIVNDKLSHAYEVLRSIFIAEQHKVRK